MGYTKPYTYVDSTVLSADNHSSNEQAIKEYVNQEVTDTDVDTDTIIGESVSTPRLITSVQTADFVSKTLQGVSKIRLPQEYSWFTSTTKSDNQISQTVKDYQTLANTGCEVVIPTANTKVMVTIYLKAYGAPNSSVTYSPNGVLFESDFKLQYERLGLITQFDGTRNYVFETQTGSPPAGQTIVPSDGGNAAGHRSIMITRMLTLNAGRYKFSVAVNSRVEKGNINCQTFTVETFHV